MKPAHFALLLSLSLASVGAFAQEPTGCEGFAKQVPCERVIGKKSPAQDDEKQKIVPAKTIPAEILASLEAALVAGGHDESSIMYFDGNRWVSVGQNYETFLRTQIGRNEYGEFMAETPIRLFGFRTKIGGARWLRRETIAPPSDKAAYVVKFTLFR